MPRSQKKTPELTLDRTVRLLVIGMVGAAGAFNLQAHAAIEAVATATVDETRVVVLDARAGQA